MTNPDALPCHGYNFTPYTDNHWFNCLNYGKCPCGKGIIEAIRKKRDENGEDNTLTVEI